MQRRCDDAASLSQALRLTPATRESGVHFIGVERGDIARDELLAQVALEIDRVRGRSPDCRMPRQVDGIGDNRRCRSDHNGSDYAATLRGRG